MVVEKCRLSVCLSVCLTVVILHCKRWLTHLKMWCLMCHMSCVMCYVSHTTWHLSLVTNANGSAKESPSANSTSMHRIKAGSQRVKKRLNKKIIATTKNPKRSRGMSMLAINSLISIPRRSKFFAMAQTDGHPTCGYCWIKTELVQRANEVKTSHSFV